MSSIVWPGKKVKGQQGTLISMAPEIIKHNEFDHRADIWSLGVILFEMLTNTLPFYHKDPVMLQKLILSYEINYDYISKHS